MDQREAAAGSGTTRHSRLFIAAKKRRGSINMRLCLSAIVNHGVGDGGGGGRGRVGLEEVRSVCTLYSSNKSDQQSRASDLCQFKGKSEEDGLSFLRGVWLVTNHRESSRLFPPPSAGTISGASPCTLRPANRKGCND